MILGVDKILKLVKEKKLVENLCDRELKNPEGAGFDLRIGEIYEIYGKGFLGIEERQTPKTRLLVKYNPKKKLSFVFKPGKYYLMKTIERVNTPENILILFRPRSTIFRMGLTIFTANVSPGYKGELIFGIINIGPCKVEIELGARVAYAMFFEVKGKSNLYRGQWQGGRVTTKKKEKQV
jgi:deoxycytidine triphosphate deaminase